MSMKYEDKSATQFEGNSSLAIPVKQEPRFEFSEIQVAPDTFRWEKKRISHQISIIWEE